MKSAWELALEKTGGAIEELPQEKKDQIAEIDNRCKAKLAEIEITYDSKMKNAGNIEELEQIKQDMAVEKASVTSKTEREKEAIRNS
ncbi:MAG: hypothetical protein GY750_16080 [Lentisphaerae bacterium]|nr:hypothetical protein [Lentisphaerota bacterium]MCP4102914.1 hypothetical protein [Lentisphaerota bacterium]